MTTAANHDMHDKRKVNNNTSGRAELVLGVSVTDFLQDGIFQRNLNSVGYFARSDWLDFSTESDRISSEMPRHTRHTHTWHKGMK